VQGLKRLIKTTFSHRRKFKVNAQGRSILEQKKTV